MCTPASTGLSDPMGVAIVVVFGGVPAVAAIATQRKRTRGAALSMAALATALAFVSLAFRPDAQASPGPPLAAWAYLFISFGLTWTLVVPALAWLVAAFSSRRSTGPAAVAVSMVPLAMLTAWWAVRSTIDACEGLA